MGGGVGAVVLEEIFSEAFPRIVGVRVLFVSVSEMSGLLLGEAEQGGVVGSGESEAGDAADRAVEGG